MKMEGPTEKTMVEMLVGSLTNAASQLICASCITVLICTASSTIVKEARIIWEQVE